MEQFTYEEPRFRGADVRIVNTMETAFYRKNFTFLKNGSSVLFNSHFKEDPSLRK